MKWSRLVVSAGLVLAVAQACGSDDGQGDDNRRRRDAGADGSAGSAGDGGSAGKPGVGGTAGTGVGGTSGSGGTGAGGTAGGGGVDGSAAAGGTGGARDGGGGSAGRPDGGGGSAGGPDGGGGSAGGPIFSCGTFGTTCSSGAQCCSKVCNPQTNRCAASSTCSVAGTSCSAPTDCCSQRCQGNVCQAAACVSDGGGCSLGTQCCSGTCESGQCKALNLECKTAGNTCSGNSQCCSKLCTGGKCELRASFCTQMGDVCSRAEECCTGRCDKTAGATLGTCGDAPSGSTNCSGRGVEGSVCASAGAGSMICNECCSRLCAPYGPTGVFVCQPASGCHVNGDFCRTNNDCCGAAGTGLPGDGNVTCQKDAGATLGVCRNPMSCNPQGNVCHYKGSDGGYVCGGSSSRNNCCGDTGNQDGTCQLDTLGVPRCNGLGACRTSGTTCASADDCCNNAPCVPDSAGVLRCYAVPDGGRSCVPTAGSCTINGDCCPGAICVRPVGSTRGVCGVITTTPPGDGGTPSDGGIKDGGAGGSSGSGGAGGSGGVPQCSEYGQQCQSSSNCCNAVPCNGGICRFFG